MSSGSIYPPPLNLPSEFNPSDWPTQNSTQGQLSAYVTLNTGQNITGFKTFSTAPQMNSILNQNGQTITLPSNAATLATTNRDQIITGQNRFGANAALFNNLLNSTGNVVLTFPTGDNRVSLSTGMFSLQDNVLSLRGDYNHYIAWANTSLYGYDGVFIGGYGNDASGKSRAGGLWTTLGNILSLSWCPDNVSIYAPSPGNAGNVLCATFSSNITLAQPVQVTGNVVNCSPGTILLVSNTDASASSTSGAFRTNGGIYVGANSRFNRALQLQGDSGNLILSGPNSIVTIANSQSANSITTGCLRLAGGLSSNAACFFGSTIFQSGGSTGNNFSYGFLNSLGVTGTGSGVNSYGIISSSRIAATEFNATSSRLIKNIQGNAVSDPNVITSAISLFKSIPLSKYKYIDEVKNGSETYYGVIAESMPSYRTASNSNYIPNFYQYGNITMDSENGNCLITLEGNVRDPSDFTNQSYILAYSGESYNNYESFQDVTLVDNRTLIGTYPNYNSANIDQTRMFFYGSNEQVPNVNKFAYLELCATITRNLLQRVEVLEARFP